jgi:transposase InsO family protein
LGWKATETLRKDGIDRIRQHNTDQDAPWGRQAYSNWKAKYGVTSVPELRRLKELEQENAKLNRMYAELAFENAAIKDWLGRKLAVLSARRAVAAILVQDHGLSIVAGCRIARLSRAAWFRAPRDRAAAAATVIKASLALVEVSPQWGFCLCRDWLRELGHWWNWKLIYRVCCALGLNLNVAGKSGC